MNQLKMLGRGIAACALLGGVSAAEPLTTHTPSFQIPFAVEADGNGTPQGTAILFASKDGAPLEQLQRVDASAGAFQFTAPSDGLYAFTVRMTDAEGKVAGEAGPLKPELEVRVDTTAPELLFQLAETSAGEILVTWDCNETSVDGQSLRLEYAEGSDGRWIPIEATPGASGQATVRTQPGNSIYVRGMITDAAGNRGIGSGQIVLKDRGPQTFSPPPPQPQSYSNNQSTMTIPGNSGNSNGSSQSSQMLGANPFANSSQNNKASNSNDQHYSTANYGAAPSSNFGPTDSVSVNRPLTNGTPPDFRPSTNYGNYSTTGYASGVNSAPPAAGGQIVGNRAFDIAYEVDDVGPSGVSSVQLFVTENNGQEWFRYGDDTDLRSPFQVDTRGEGTFGFAVRVRNGVGFSDPPPQPGETPSIVVTVDQTPPVARLAEPLVQTNGQGRIRLNWKVSDANPTGTPVRLEYAVSSAGPWTPVFDWDSDRGGYDMPIEPGMPNTMYFRLLARDAAGNVATATTPHPLMIDQHRPTARLLSIQPVSTNRSY